MEPSPKRLRTNESLQASLPKRLPTNETLQPVAEEPFLIDEFISDLAIRGQERFFTFL